MAAAARPTAAVRACRAPARSPAASGELLFDEDRLRIYYDKIFPYKLMFKWMSYGKLNTN